MPVGPGRSFFILCLVLYSLSKELSFRRSFLLFKLLMVFTLVLITWRCASCRSPVGALRSLLRMVILSCLSVGCSEYGIWTRFELRDMLMKVWFGMVEYGSRTGLGTKPLTRLLISGDGELISRSFMLTITFLGRVDCGTR